MARNSGNPPKVFISYKWQDETRNAWVEKLYIDAQLDKYEVDFGESFIDYMTNRIGRECDDMLNRCQPLLNLCICCHRMFSCSLISWQSAFNFPETEGGPQGPKGLCHRLLTNRMDKNITYHRAEVKLLACARNSVSALYSTFRYFEYNAIYTQNQG